MFTSERKLAPCTKNFSFRAKQAGGLVPRGIVTAVLRETRKQSRFIKIKNQRPSTRNKSKTKVSRGPIFKLVENWSPAHCRFLFVPGGRLLVCLRAALKVNLRDALSSQLSNTVPHSRWHFKSTSPVALGMHPVTLWFHAPRPSAMPCKRVTNRSGGAFAG